MDFLLVQFHFTIRQEEKLKVKAKENNANAYLLEMPCASEGDSLIGWLKDNPPCDTEESRLAKVRDGTDSIEVILVKKKENGLYLLDGTTSIHSELTPALAKKISQQTIRLPHIFHYKTSEVIEELELRNRDEIPYWQESPWLKGSLGIILDECNCSTLAGYRIHYDKQYGMTYGKEEK